MPVAKIDWVNTAVAARFILGMSDRMVRRMCEDGVFKSAHKPGKGTGASSWRISRTEVESHLIRRSEA